MINFETIYDDLISYKSKLDNSFTVYIIYKENELYDQIHNILKEINSVASLQVGTKNIFVDGEKIKNLTMNHILAMEAHEIAHSILGHDTGILSDEEEADKYGMKLLLSKKYTHAAKILQCRQYPIKFEPIYEKLFEKNN